MSSNKQPELKIFESPDGGKTIYCRKPGEVKRELYWQDPQAKLDALKAKNAAMWVEIQEMAENNTALRKAIENVIVIYKLSLEHAK